MLVHKAGHYGVYLTATVSQGIDVPPLNNETHKGLWADPMHSWPLFEEQGGMADGCYTGSYFCGGCFGAGALFSGPAPLEFKCSLCHVWKVS